MDLIGAADGGVNSNMGYIKITPSEFKLAHNNTNIIGEFDLGIASVTCKDLSVINNGIIKELGVTNNVTSSKIICTELAVTNSAILPKIISRP